MQNNCAVGDIALLLRGKFGYLPQETRLFNKFKIPLTETTIITGKNGLTDLKFRGTNTAYIEPKSFITGIKKDDRSEPIKIGVFSQCTEIKALSILNHLDLDCHQSSTPKSIITMSKEKKTFKPFSSLFYMCNAKIDMKIVINSFIKSYGYITEEQEDALYKHYYEFENPMFQEELIEFVELQLEEEEFE